MSTSNRIAGSLVVMRHSISFAVAPITVTPPQTLPSSDVTTNEFAVQFDTTATGCAGGGTGGAGIVGVGVRSPAQLERRTKKKGAPRLRLVTQPTLAEARATRCA